VLFCSRVYALGSESTKRREELTAALKQFGPISQHIVLGRSALG